MIHSATAGIDAAVNFKGKGKFLLPAPRVASFAIDSDRLSFCGPLFHSSEAFIDLFRHPSFR